MNLDHIPPSAPYLKSSWTPRQHLALNFSPPPPPPQSSITY